MAPIVTESEVHANGSMLTLGSERKLQKNYTLFSNATQVLGKNEKKLTSLTNERKSIMTFSRFHGISHKNRTFSKAVNILNPHTVIVIVILLLFSQEIYDGIEIRLHVRH